ncbi:hypothetical protein HDV06_004413 [Boothiomyces sp. JEL0866]|nr:hypothetical protein HDV06_004413 [Boothiomyces sp. JEL0866]
MQEELPLQNQVVDTRESKSQVNLEKPKSKKKKSKKTKSEKALSVTSYSSDDEPLILRHSNLSAKSLGTAKPNLGMSHKNLSQPTVNHIYIPPVHPAGYSAATYSASHAKAPQVIFNPYGQEPHEEKKKKKDSKKRHSISSKNSSSLSKSSKSTNESISKSSRSSSGIKESKSLEKVRSKSKLNDDFDTRSERRSRKSLADDFDTRSERKSRKSMALDDFDSRSVASEKSKRSKKKEKTVSVRSSSIPAPPTSRVIPNEEDEDVPLSQKKKEYNRLSSRSQETLTRASSLKLGRPSDLNLYDRKRESSSSATFVAKEEPVVEKKKGIFTRLFNCFKSSDNLKKKATKEDLSIVKTPSNTSYRSLDPNRSLDPKLDFRSRLDPKSSAVTLTDRGAPSKYDFDLPQIISTKPYQPISTAKPAEPLEFGLELDDIMSKYFDSTKVTRPQRRNTQTKTDKLNYSVDVDPELFEFRGFL